MEEWQSAPYEQNPRHPEHLIHKSSFGHNVRSKSEAIIATLLHIFGMMDNPSYAKKTCTKLNLYTSHNIIPSINLITTYETQASPLSSELVKQIIEYYFT